MTVELRNETEREIDEGFLTGAALCALSGEGRPEADVFVLIVDDEAIQRLNSRYLGRDRPTDVIAFALSEAPGPDGVPESLGDVVVSIETALRQAAELGEPAEREMARLVMHGVLHLLGWDDLDPDKADAMHARTEQLLREFGTL